MARFRYRRAAAAGASRPDGAPGAGRLVARHRTTPSSSSHAVTRPGPVERRAAHRLLGAQQAAPAVVGGQRKLKDSCSPRGAFRVTTVGADRVYPRSRRGTGTGWRGGNQSERRRRARERDAGWVVKEEEGGGFDGLVCLLASSEEKRKRVPPNARG
jgi:hypothetical protein